MAFEPMSPYFLVKINRKEQSDKKEKIGNIIIPNTIVFQTRNVQAGEIVSIGSDAAKLFPQAKVGQILLLHWMVENPEKFQYVDSDETYNYYVVTACEYNGQVNQSYGIWDGEKIVPHPEYIFLEQPPVIDGEWNTEDKISNATIVSKGGLLVFKEWKLTRAEKEEKMAKLKEEIQSLCKTRMDEQLKKAIEIKEAEISAISSDINSKRVEFYTIAAISPELIKHIETYFNEIVSVGDKLGILNIACQTTIDFMGKTYVVALCKHIHCTQKWAERSVKSYKNEAAKELAAV